MFATTSITDRIQSFLEEHHSDLPVFDRTAMLVHQEASRPDPDTNKVLSYISQDQILTADILKIANSSFFQGLKKISRIQDALVRIGLREIVNCVLISTQRKNYNSDNPFVQEYTTVLWRHSLACAFAAQWLSKRGGHPDLAPEAFIAGLLHDVGKLPVLKALVDVGAQDLDAPRLTRAVADEFLNSIHMDTGYELLLKWGLPDFYAVICRDHHRFDYDPTNILLVIVRLANLTCRKMGIGLHEEKDLVLATCSEAGVLGFSDIVLAELEIAVEDYLLHNKL